MFVYFNTWAEHYLIVVIVKPDIRISMSLRTLLLHLHRCVRLVPSRQVHELASLRRVSLLPEKRRLGLLYPFSSLEAHLSRQVDKTRFQLFQPDLEALEWAEKLFTPSPKHQIVYSSSAVRTDHMPELTQPEVRGNTRLFRCLKQNTSLIHMKYVYSKMWPICEVHSDSSAALLVGVKLFFPWGVNSGVTQTTQTILLVYLQ